MANSHDLYFKCDLWHVSSSVLLAPRCVKRTNFNERFTLGGKKKQHSEKRKNQLQWQRRAKCGSIRQAAQTVIEAVAPKRRKQTLESCRSALVLCHIRGFSTWRRWVSSAPSAGTGGATLPAQPRGHQRNAVHASPRAHNSPSLGG